MPDKSDKANVAYQIPDVSATPKLESISEKALENGEGPTLDQQKFLLEQKKAIAKLDQTDKEFNPLLYAKIATIVLSLVYVAALATSLIIFTWHGDKAIHDWHVLIALLSGGYLSIFGVLAILIKGMFAKEKDETPPMTLAEILKTLVDTVRATRVRQ